MVGGFSDGTCDFCPLVNTLCLCVVGRGGGKGRLDYFCLVWFGPRALLPPSFFLSFPEHNIGKEAVLERAHAGYFQDKHFQPSAGVRDLGHLALAHRGMLQDLEVWVLPEAAVQALREKRYLHAASRRAVPARNSSSAWRQWCLLCGRWGRVARGGTSELLMHSQHISKRSSPSFVHVSPCEVLSVATSPRAGPEPQRLPRLVRSRVSLS